MGRKCTKSKVFLIFHRMTNIFRILFALKFRSLTLLQYNLNEKLCTSMRGPLKIDPIQSKILELLKVYKSAFRYRLQINYKHR